MFADIHWVFADIFISEIHLKGAYMSIFAGKYFSFPAHFGVSGRLTQRGMSNSRQRLQQGEGRFIQNQVNRVLIFSLDFIFINILFCKVDELVTD